MHVRPVIVVGRGGARIHRDCDLLSDAHKLAPKITTSREGVLTVHTGSAPDALSALYRELTAIEVFTRSRDDVPNCLRSGLEVRKEACRLNVGEVVPSVWAGLED